jgi:signal transduction histidine kinase
MKKGLIFFFIVFTNILFSQKKINDFIAKIDTVKTPKRGLEKLDSVYANVKLNPRTKVILNHKRLQYCMTLSDFKRVTKISIETIEFAKKHKLDSLTAFPYMMIGCSQYMNNRLDDALVSFKFSAKLAERYKNYTLMGSNYNNIGGLLIDKKNYKEGEKYLLKSINLSIKTKDTRSKILSSRILATSFERQGKLKEAASIYEKIEKEAITLGDAYILSSVFTYHGELLKKLGNSNLAIEKVKEAKKLMYRIGDTSSIMTVIRYEADFFKEVKNFENEALSLREYINLKDKYYNDKNQNQINQLETKFKTKEIQQEKTLVQSKMLAEKSKKNNYLLILIILLLSSIGFFVILYLRNSRKSAQIQLQIQEQRLISIIEGQESERTRIAKELHDGIVQDLTVLKMNLSSNDTKETLEPKLTKITKEVRELSYQMMPIALKELGLIAALQDLFDRSFTQRGIAFNFEAYDLEERLDQKIEVNIYRICQELINNTLKHAGATEINIILRKKDNLLTLIFEDNGNGFDLLNIKNGIGLNSLKDRLEAIHGKVEFDSEINKGTTAYIKINIL